MKLSDEIRQHVIQQHIEAAKCGGREKLTIRAGDIHKKMGLSNRIAAVCSVLGSKRLEKEAGVQRLSAEGPYNGYNASFTYLLKGLGR